jgi:hypothetical protein
MCKLIKISKLKVDDVILPEASTEHEKEKQTNIVAGTSIVRGGDNPLQLAFSPTAVFNITHKSNIDGYDNRELAAA